MYLEKAGALPASPEAGPKWCGMFVYWCYTEAAKRSGKVNPLPTAVFGGTDFKAWASRNPACIVWTSSKPNPKLEPGDVFVAAEDGHVGMVVSSTDRNTGSFISIEGNQTAPTRPDWGTHGIRIKPTKALRNCSMIVRPPSR